MNNKTVATKSSLFFCCALAFVAAGRLGGAAIGPSVVAAQTRSGTFESSPDPRGKPELVVCSQNLDNYGLPALTQNRENISAAEFQAKEQALVQRFATAGCDVIAVQEVLGKNEEEALQGLRGLARALRTRQNRIYEAYVGATNDKTLRNGFLVASDRATVAATMSYANIELPKISPKQKPRFFSRGPFEIQLLVKPTHDVAAGKGADKAAVAGGGAETRNVVLVNFHFKSKSGKVGDPTGLEWETYRMEMSEGLRRVVEARHRRSFTRGEVPLILLGDRNSNFDLASAKILDGTLTLRSFQTKGGCRMSKRGVPLCQAQSGLPRVLFSVLTDDPQTKLLPGTFRYEDVYSWIDEILMPAESLRTAWARYDIAGNYDSGVVYEPRAASDHALVYVRLNW